MKKFFALLIVSLGLPAAYAAESGGSEFMYQTPVGKFDITPGILYNKLNVDMKSGFTTTSIEQSGFREVVAFEYGLSEDFSWTDSHKQFNRNRLHAVVSVTDNKGIRP